MRAILLLAILAIVACRAQAGQTTIAENGKSDYLIVTSKDPTPAEALAADELCKYIEQMSGAKLPVKHVSEWPKKAFIVSEEPDPSYLVDVENSPQPVEISEGYSIWAKETQVFIVGGRGRSVLYAVYDLLDRLGCRFLAPKLDHYEGSAEIVPRVKTLAIDLSSPVIEKPVLSLRKLYVEEGHSHNAENLIQMAEWMPKARFNTLVIPTDYSGGGRVKWDNWRKEVAPELQKRDITIEVGGHGYQNFLNAEMEGGNLFKEHPEWFGIDENGKRAPAHGRVFCTSNPRAVAYLAANVGQYVKDRPEIQIFDFWPPDGAKWCQCDRCEAMGSPSNRQAILVGQVRKYLQKIRPDLRLEFIAYAACVTPPESVKLDKDVLIDFCPIGQCFEVQINDPASEANSNYVKQLTGLRKGFDGDISIYSYYRKYAWKSLPNLIPHYMQKDLQFYLTVPVQGISSYAEPGDWFAYELNHYVLGNLAWDPNADVDAVMKKFAEARFGNASKAALDAYQTLEDVVRHACSIPGTSLKTADELTQAQAKLDQAAAGLKAAQTSVDDPEIRRNIDRMSLMFEYARRDIAIQKSKAVGAKKEDTQKQIGDLVEFIARHGKDGVFLVHSRLQIQGRILKTYGLAE